MTATNSAQAVSCDQNGDVRDNNDPAVRPLPLANGCTRTHSPCTEAQSATTSSVSCAVGGRTRAGMATSRMAIAAESPWKKRVIDRYVSHLVTKRSLEAGLGPANAVALVRRR